MSDHYAIANLLYTYAERIDAGDLAGAAELFSRATIHTQVGDIDAAGVLEMWRGGIILYDGVPRTKHLVTNPIIEVDEAAGTATSRAVYTVIQQVGAGPLRAIVSGRYHDKFSRDTEGQWYFTHRDYSMTDLIGEAGEHARGLTE